MTSGHDNVQWLVVCGILGVALTVTGVMIRFLLNHFLVSLSSNVKDVQSNLQTTISAVQKSLDEVVAEKNRAHAGIWAKMDALQTDITDLKLKAARAITLEQFSALNDKLESLSKDVHELRSRGRKGTTKRA